RPTPMPHDARRANAGIALGGDGAGDARPVSLPVADGVAVRDPVPAVQIVREAVVVVVASVRTLARVRPLVVDEIGVGEVYAAVDVGDDGGGWAGSPRSC